MTRDIGTVNLAEAAANGSYEVLFAEMVIGDTDIIRLSTLFQPVTFMTQDNTSQTFEGAGHLLNVSAVNDSIDVKQTSVNLTLTALDSVVINQVTNTPFLGSEVTVYRGYWDEEAGALAARPYILWRGIVNDYAAGFGGQLGQDNRASITVTCKNLIVSILEQQAGRFTSVSSFQEFNPNDMSMEFVSQMASFNPQFGKED